MDKNAIKKYAVWARRDLIERVTQRALFYGVTATEKADPAAASVNGRLLSDTEKAQRQALIAQVDNHGFDQTIEEAAYTWFNRFAALRVMEVNNYLPTHTRVFTNDAGEFKPQLLTEAIHIDLDGLDPDRVYELKNADKDEELYRYLLITQCNALNKILPGMFQKIADYTELLLPDHLLRTGSVIEQMVTLIPEQDWQDQVQIIGWLYQYYNSEPKDEVFAKLKKNVKVTKDSIPAATQLFTPDWIVRYMVENSLGRLWLAGHPNDALQAKWHYYIPDAPQEAAVTTELDTLKADYSCLLPEDLSLVDCCSGSGHILAYAFDVLMDIYTAQSYKPWEAVQNILEHNLYGLDIDERAWQLTYFSLMMKARQYDRSLFSRGLRPHACAIEESNGLTKWSDMRGQVKAGQMTLDDKFFNLADELIDTFHDAKNYGSLLQVEEADYDGLLDYLQQLVGEGSSNLFLNSWLQQVSERMPQLIRQAKLLSRKYWACVTNPPYMGASNMNPELNSFIKKHYADYKSDMFSACMVRFTQMTEEKGFLGFLSPYVWMFISSYEKLRELFIQQKTIETLIQFEYSAFEEATVPICTFVLRNCHLNKKGVYFRLTDYRGGMEVQRKKMLEALDTHDNKMYFASNAENFVKIPGSPVAYWVSDAFFNIISHCQSLDALGHLGKGLDTGNNDLFLKHWFEISDYTKWKPCIKGGSFRKWYGNLDYVINWEKNGESIKKYPASNLRNYKYYFHEGLTWSRVSSGLPSFRYFGKGYIFESTGPCGFFSDVDLKYVLGLLNTKITTNILTFLAPTLDFQSGHISRIPYKNNKCFENQINDIVGQNIKFSKLDWDSFETSWDFQTHPLLTVGTVSLTERYEQFKAVFQDRFDTLRANEEELNRIFIDIYGLQDELTPDVASKDVTVHRIFDSKDDVPDDMRGSNYVLTKEDVIKSFISYAVGCMFGRYSLDTPGLAYAGGDWDDSKYKTFIPDNDNVIPICDDEYFDDDMVGRFVKFVETVYGSDTLEENLVFIADALGGRGTPREVIRNYFLKDFFKDHCKTYQKRPIYWLFSSGKKNGFKCLIYMHRYQPDTLARIRTDYVHEQQSRYHTALADLEQRINGAATRERVKLQKRFSTIQAQAEELHDYEEKIHHLADQMISIDLDDGVKHNYAIFQDVLAKIQ